MGEVSIWIEKRALTKEAKEKWEEWDIEKEGYLVEGRLEVEEMYIDKDTGDLVINWNSKDKGVSGTLTIPVATWTKEMLDRNWEGNLAEFLTKRTQALQSLLHIRTKVEKSRE